MTTSGPSRTLIGEVSDGEVAALLRRFYALDFVRQLRAAEFIGLHLKADTTIAALGEAARAQREALETLAAAARELDLPAGVAPTTRAFNGTTAARVAGLNAARIIRLFGRWEFAVDRLLGRSGRHSAEQRAAERAARRGVYRNREDYLLGLRLWLNTRPASLTTDDYDAWRSEYNARRPAGEPPLVSYSMLRKAFKCDWSDLLEVARGALTLAEADARSRRAPLARDEGPDQLIGFAEVRELLGLSTTAARNVTLRPGFPPPVYVHPRGARQRLWRRIDVERHLAGGPGAQASEGLEGTYIDANAVAEILGFAPITVTTGSSPRVPAPHVRAAGLQLWLRSEVERVARCEKAVLSAEVLAASANEEPRQPQPQYTQPHPSDRRASRG